MEIDLHVHGLVDRDLQELVLETELCLFPSSQRLRGALHPTSPGGKHWYAYPANA